MAFYRLLLTLLALGTLFVVANPASAQEIDLGNDGIDMDCDDFPERNAVEGYFAHDGGSAERNVDNLDPDSDGIPCNEADYDDGEEPTPVPAEGFPLSAFAAYCEPEHAGPFVGCTPWAGVTVTFVAIDTNFSTTCTTEAGERVATCRVVVPFGSTIEASIDPATIPAGYILQGDALQQLTIPDGPPAGEFGGPTFILLESGDTGAEEPAEEEPEYVPPVVGDEPQTDPEPAAVTSLPSTGTGPGADTVLSGASVAIVLAGAATLMATGAIRVRWASR